MSSLWTVLPAAGWERLAVDALWQSTLIAGGALVAVRLAGRRPALRAAILLSAAALSLGVPLLSGAVRWGGGGLLTAPARVVTQPLEEGSPTPPHATVGSAGPSTIAAPVLPRPSRIDWASRAEAWLIGGWLAASVCLGLRLVRGVFMLRRWITTATACHDPAIKAELSRAARLLGVRRPKIFWTTALNSPALVSVGRPRLLLPVEMPPQVDWFAVFCHELAHQARRDHLGRLVVELVVTALPWQPLLWLVRQKFRAAAEEACDDWAVAAGADPIEFASLLVDLVPQRQPALALGMADSPRALRQRIARLLAMTRATSPGLGIVVGAIGGALAATLAIGVALLQYNSGPRMVKNTPPWGERPLAEAIAQAKRDWSQAKWWVANLPTENDKSTLPPYTIEPPDVVSIDANKAVPKSPYHLERGDALRLEVIPSDGSTGSQFEIVVNLEGQLSLGAAWGSLDVVGLTLPEAREAMKAHLAKTGHDLQISLTLSSEPIERQISGQHPVAPDGTINLGTYGTVNVAGLTIAAAKAAIEAQLANYLEAPRVSLDIFSSSSKVYYIITEGAGTGDCLVRVPITGNETVLDALAQINGLKRLAQKNIWVARPTPGELNRDVILPVSFDEIAKGTATDTNYQVFPGDRIFIQEKFSKDPLDEQPDEESVDEAAEKIGKPNEERAVPIHRAA